MGVFKVNVGDAVTPDWRNVGCGGSTGDPNAYPTAANTVTVYCDSSGTLYGYTNALSQPTADVVDVDINNLFGGSTIYYMTFLSGSRSGNAIFTLTGTGITAPGRTINYGEARDASHNYLGSVSVSPGTVQAYSAPTVGRLKLWDGTRWVREKCDDETPTTVTDDFTGTDGTVLAGRALTPNVLTWSATSSAVIASNQASLGTGGAIWTALSNPEPSVAADMTLTGGLIQTDLYMLSAAGGGGINDSYLFRYAAFGNHYQAYRNGATITPTTGTNDVAIATGTHTFSMTMASGLVTFKIDGTTVMTYNDPTPLTGAYAGLSSPSGGGLFDNFEATAIPSHPLYVNAGTPSVPDWQLVACMTPVRPPPAVIATGGGYASFGTSFNTDLPAAPAAGDILIATLNISQYLATRSVSTPSGWTQQLDSTDTNVRMYVFTKVCGSGESATIPWSVSGSAENHTGALVQYRGATITGFQAAASASVTAASSGGMPITCQCQDYGSAFVHGVSEVTETGWTTDIVVTPPYHQTFMGHGPETMSGDVVDPAVMWNGASPPPPSAWRYATCVLYPV